MRCWIVAAVLVLGSQFAGAEEQVLSSYSCEDPPVDRLRFSPGFQKLVESFFESTDSGERAKIASRIAGWADTRAEKARAKYIKALSLLDGQNGTDAETMLVNLLDNDYLSRDTVASIRIVLARLALKRDDYDGMRRWLEPIDAANCPVTPDEVRRMLAFAYQQLKLPAETLRQADLIGLKDDDPGAQRWRAIRIDLGCQLEGASACMQRIGDPAYWGALAGESLEMALSHLGRLQTTPEGQQAIAQAHERGVVDAEGRLIVSRALPVEAVNSPRPLHPRRAKGISGYVDVGMVINPDGTVKSAEVVEARPPGYFESAALSAARASTFKPKMLNGEAVESRGIRRYTFQGY